MLGSFEIKKKKCQKQTQKRVLLYLNPNLISAPPFKKTQQQAVIST